MPNGAGGEGLQVQVQAPEAMPALDAAVEVAAYRIVLEALANVVNHAGARHCVITLDAGEELLVDIIDDGCGLPADVPPGIGLRSMRARAEELGGVLTLREAPGGGTCVCARLPLAAKPA